MSIPTLTGIPRQFTAGDTVIFTETFQDYPATDWTAKLWLSLIGGTPFSISASASGSDFLFNIAETTTQAIVAAQYEFSEVVTSNDNTQRRTPKVGVVNILPNFAIAQTPSTAQAQLAAINDAITRLLASGEYSSTNFNGQSFSYADLDKLREYKVFLEAQMVNERNVLNVARGGCDPGRIGIQFAPQQSGQSFFGLPYPLR